jgi:hypothetical protein
MPSDDYEDLPEAVTALLPVPFYTPYMDLPAAVAPVSDRRASCHLDEHSTTPVYWETTITLLELEQTLRAFCHVSDFLERGLPYVTEFEWDDVLLMPHIHIHLQVPFPSPSQATLRGVRMELEAFTRQLVDRFGNDIFAVSAHLT